MRASEGALFVMEGLRAFTSIFQRRLSSYTDRNKTNKRGWFQVVNTEGKKAVIEITEEEKEQN